MATAQKSVSTEKAPKAQEASALLKADHKAVDLLFQQYESARSATKNVIKITRHERLICQAAQKSRQTLIGNVRMIVLRSSIVH